VSPSDFPRVKEGGGTAGRSTKRREKKEKKKGGGRAGLPLRPSSWEREERGGEKEKKATLYSSSIVLRIETQGRRKKLTKNSIGC